MKTYHRIASLIFNTPLMVIDHALDIAVSWANSTMGLNIVNLIEPQAAMRSEGDRITPAERRMLQARETGVYIIPIHGPLVARSMHLDLCTQMTSYEFIRENLNAALNDSGVAHIVMDIDSPGGSSTGLFELAAEIAQAKTIKPITAIVNFSAYSAAYALASAATEIICSQSSGVGSIGVIARHVDLSRRYETEGVKVTSIYAGARKNDLTDTAPLSDEASQFLQEMVQDNYNTFVQTVAANRGLTVQTVANTEAAVYFGQKAVDAGLADSIESPQVAINRIAAQAVASKKQAPVYATRAAAMNLQNSL